MSALCCASLFVAAPAQAETLDELQAKADQATAAYNDATQNVDQLQAKIDEAQQQIADVESQLPGAREKAGVAMTALYHPAAILRDPGKRPETFDDLKSLQAKIRQVCSRTYEST